MTLMRQSQRHYSVEEYFLNEKMSPLKLEYFAGEIFVMSGGSRNHDRISTNVLLRFTAALRGSPREAFSAEMRSGHRPASTPIPDASIVCGPADVIYIQGTETIGNPTVLVEVLSESTRDYD